MNFVRGILLFFLIISSIIAIPFQYSEAGSNSAPVLLPIGDQKEDEDDTSELYFTATDPDSGDTLTFTSSPLPRFAVLIDNGDRTARLVMATSFNDAGSYQITITVTDNGTPNLSDSETFFLEVLDDGDPIPPEDLADRVITLDVNENVVVSPGEIVVISNGATIQGNIKIIGGTLILSDGVTVEGNVESENGGIMVISDSLVEGNIIGQGDSITIKESTIIRGNIVSDKEESVIIGHSTIYGDIQVYEAKSVRIAGNTVDGNIEILGPQSCSESLNVVSGNNSGCP